MRVRIGRDGAVRRRLLRGQHAGELVALVGDRPDRGRRRLGHVGLGLGLLRRGRRLAQPRCRAREVLRVQRGRRGRRRGAQRFELRVRLLERGLGGCAQLLLAAQRRLRRLVTGLLARELGLQRDVLGGAPLEIDPRRLVLLARGRERSLRGLVLLARGFEHRLRLFGGGSQALRLGPSVLLAGTKALELADVGGVIRDPALELGVQPRELALARGQRLVRVAHRVLARDAPIAPGLIELGGVVGDPALELVAHRGELGLARLQLFLRLAQLAGLALELGLSLVGGGSQPLQLGLLVFAPGAQAHELALLAV